MGKHPMRWTHSLEYFSVLLKNSSVPVHHEGIHHLQTSCKHRYFENLVEALIRGTRFRLEYKDEGYTFQI